MSPVELLTHLLKEKIARSDDTILVKTRDDGSVESWEFLKGRSPMALTEGWEDNLK
jgi:hypothetical protein